MISVFQSALVRTGVILILLICCFFSGDVRPISANESLSVTVMPPLFQLTIGPGEVWASAIKIVNNNAYEVTYYAQLMDMRASGEEGRSKFIPIVSEAKDQAQQSYALAHWIRIARDPIVVPAGASREVPFSVEIPTTAEPGGHYAAILIGTEPGGLHATGTVLKVSSYVSSLLFVRIKGDVVENGRIREFLTTQQLYQTPKADFLLRFENLGNAHVRPQGDITIYNMWGRERGKVLINQDTDGSFGNVLPNSIRRFQFSWEGGSNVFDIGLYSAIVTLTYGENGKKNISGKTYFWVVPVVPVAIGLGSVIFFFFMLVWFIRRYIRRALMLEQRRYGVSPIGPQPSLSIVETYIEPVRVGVVDLRNIRKVSLEPAPASKQVLLPQDEEKPQSAGQFIRKYRLFLIFLVVLIIGCGAAWLYFHTVLGGGQKFQITDVRIEAENVPVP